MRRPHPHAMPAEPTPHHAIEESAEDLYDRAPCGYLSTTPDGTIVKVNQTFLQWTGYERNDLVGKKRFAEILTAGGRIYFETHYAPLLRMQGSVREIAVDIVCAGGDRLPALVNSLLTRDSDGNPLAVRTTVFDATERRRYERELLEQRKRAQEAEARAMMLAQTLQEALIPPTPSQIPGVEVGAVYRPAGNGDVVGGDFYDVFETSRGDWIVAIGDVSGKGAEAARVTAAAKYTLRAGAMQHPEPRNVLAAVNAALLQQRSERFCTVLCARVAQDRGVYRVTVCSAGHALPLLVSASGDVRSLGRAGILLGAFPDVTLEDVVVEMQPGESMIFFTDGVTEGRRGDGEFYGDERLAGLAARCAGRTAGETARAICDEVLEFQNGIARDDIAVLVLRRP